MKQNQNEELKAVTIPTKYVFLDVVDFSRERSVEAQTYIVGALNKIVLLSLAQHNINESQRLLLPTGDGICIALLNIVEPFDIHIQLALTILKLVDKFQGYELEEMDQKNADYVKVTHVYDDEETLKLIKMREFKVRIGIEANLDNKILDING